MSSSMNRQILLKSRPVGEPKESDFTLVETPIPEPGEGEVLNRTVYLSLDPQYRSVKEFSRQEWTRGQGDKGTRGKNEVYKSDRLFSLSP